jgi:N-acetyl-alpha-D-muramate 1-phosphate uridylyltransferase
MAAQHRPTAAMVFAAGFGKRMRPLTEATPKPLIPIGNRPLIDHMLDRLVEVDIERAVVNVHYLADQIEAHLRLRHRPAIVISDERSMLLDQGGGIKKALPLLASESFFICNTDAFWIEGPKSNMAQLLAAWDPIEMDILLLVATTAPSVGVDWPGDFTMAADGRLSQREERKVAPFVYAGVGIIKAELFQSIAANVFRLAPFFFAAAEKRRLFGQRLEGIWLHVGTPLAIEEAEDALTRSIL